MADTDSTFLFSGTSFNRKKFAAVFERFKTTKGTEELKAEPTFVENENSEIQEERKNTKIVDKKRKRKKTDANASTVEGFSVFTTSTTEKVDEDFQQAEDKLTQGKKEHYRQLEISSTEKVDEDFQQAEDKLTQGKKEHYRQLERDAILRKKHNIHVSGSNVPSPLQSFAELKSRYKCKSFLLRNLAKLGFTEPTPIQRQAPAVLLSGRECFACAPTGSGKTFAFVCPILIKLKHASREGIRALILCPMRELAAQTARECKKLVEGKKFRIKLMTKQLVKSADFTTMPCDILISTPFRVQFAVQKKKLDLSKVEFLVLDESDKLFELGLLEQVDSVVKACSNPSILRSLFSATLPDTVEELARTIMHDAVRIIIGRKNTLPESVKQKLVYVGGEDGKLLALEQTFNESLNPPVLVFVQNKERAKELYNEIKFFDYRADVVHADLSEVQREAAVDNFRCGKTWVLIATDVIARGMDFKGVNLVINYDFPDSTAAYIHRNGRTGRAGRSGEAITFYTDADKPHLRSIANIMKASECEVPGWMLSLPQKRWKKHRPHRGPISTVPDGEETKIRL